MPSIFTTTAYAIGLTTSSVYAAEPTSRLRGKSIVVSGVAGISNVIDSNTADHHLLSLTDFQRVLRTGLDDELNLIAAGGARTLSSGSSSSSPCHDDCSQGSSFDAARSSGETPNPLFYSTQRTTNKVRRRDQQGNNSASYFSQEHVWTHLLNHAWSTAESLARIGANGPLTLLDSSSNNDYMKRFQHPSPILLCSSSHRYDVSSIFKKDDQHLLYIPPSITDGSCLVFTGTADYAHEILNSRQVVEAQAQEDITVQPLVDVMKIQSGTIERISSPEWQIPYQGPTSGLSPQEQGTIQGVSRVAFNSTTQASFSSSAKRHWERTLTVALAPGLGIQQENDLLRLVNTMMSDIQEMGEVGWLQRTEDSQENQEEYLKEHHLEGVPSLSELFSLTSNKSIKEDQQNDRINYWHNTISSGLESYHACSSMFATLLISPNNDHHSGTYTSFDIVLNPNDAPPPQEYISSSSNVHCVTSLVAGLSVHPRVMSVEGNNGLLMMSESWSLASLR